MRARHGLHVVDWDLPQNTLMALATVPMTLFEGVGRVAPHVRGEFPGMVRGARFADVEVRDRYMSLFGTVGLLRARKPG